LWFLGAGQLGNSTPEVLDQCPLKSVESFMPISVGLLSGLLKLCMNIWNYFNGCETTFNSSF